MTYHSLTFTALSRRADSVVKDDTVADIIGGEDYRQITAFLEHEIASRPNGDDVEYTTIGKTIIGVCLCDLDDPMAEIEVLDRSEALELFGRTWVEQMERM